MDSNTNFKLLSLLFKLLFIQAKIDIVSINSEDINGNKINRFFINASNIGLGGEVVKKVNSSSKLFGGFATFLLSTIGTVMEYDNKEFKLIYDKTDEVNGVYSNIVVGNGKYCGGGMKFLPDAEPDDEILDILTIGDINKIEFFENVFKVYNGTHLKFPKTNLKKCKNFEIISNHKIRIEVDGEEFGFTPAFYEVVPRILNVIY